LNQFPDVKITLEAGFVLEELNQSHGAKYSMRKLAYRDAVSSAVVAVLVDMLVLATAGFLNDVRLALTLF
jgi:hypothetical protein